MATKKNTTKIEAVSSETKAVKALLPDELNILLRNIGVSNDSFLEEVKKAKTEAGKRRVSMGITGDDVLEATMESTIAGMSIPKSVFKHAHMPTDKTYIRELVRFYYIMQENRIKIGNQVAALEREGKNNLIMKFFAGMLKGAEDNIQTFIDAWTDTDVVGTWAKSQCGIGPVLAAAHVAYFDVTKTKTAGGFWQYIGWSSESVPKKRGEKLAYNPKARVVAWKAGDSFIMQHKRPACVYGKLYAAKKAEYQAKNESGGFAEKAKRELAKKNYGKNTDAYKAYSAGKLPPAHIEAMAHRFASKIFLSHLFDVMYITEYGELPPVPYVQSELGHVHIDKPTNLELIIPYLEEKFPDKDWNTMIQTYLR